MMFKHTKLRLIGKEGDFEVLKRSTDEVVGAIIRHTGTERQWEESGGGLPYDVFHNGKKIGETTSLPLAQKIIDEVVRPPNRR